MDNLAGSIEIPDGYSDEEINYIADWLKSLKFEELFLIKQSYEMIKAEQLALKVGALYVN